MLSCLGPINSKVSHGDANTQSKSTKLSVCRCNCCWEGITINAKFLLQTIVVY